MKKHTSSIRWNFNGTFTRLREGDLVKYDNQEVRVERVTPTAAYIALPREARSFTTLMGQTVTLKPSARRVAISANSEIPILNRRAA
jgi:hypothetical protein